MKPRQLVFVLLLLIVFCGSSEWAFAQTPTMSPRRSGVSTVWVASEVILGGGNIDLALSIDKNWVVVDWKIQEAEGDETYNDPKRTDWVDCDKTTYTCGPKVPIKFIRFLPPFPSRDGAAYNTYSVQAQNGSNVRFRARYALEIQPAAAAKAAKGK